MSFYEFVPKVSLPHGVNEAEEGENGLGFLDRL